MVVDEVSLIKDGPIRVKVMAREISKLRGFVEFFITGVGYEVKVTPESNGTRNVPPPPPPNKPDDDTQGGEDDDLYDTDEEPPNREHNRHKFVPPTTTGSGGDPTDKHYAG